MLMVIFLVVAVFSFGFAFFIIKNPKKIFEIQKKFYALINWRIEPISLEKEIRNTKLMGLFLFLFTLIICIYYFFSKQ